MILEQLQKKQIEYMKSRDTFSLDIVRYLISQMRYKEIELRPQGVSLDDALCFKVLQKEAKKRNEVIEQFKTAGRTDLVEKNTKELAFIQDLISQFQPTE